MPGLINPTMHCRHACALGAVQELCSVALARPPILTRGTRLDGWPRFRRGQRVQFGALGMSDLSISVENPIHAGPLGATVSMPVSGPAKAKVDELFCRWLAMPDTATLVNGWIAELHAGKTIVPPNVTHTSLRTPTSRLSAPVSPSRTAATGFTPPLSPSRFGTRPSAGQPRFCFGENGQYWHRLAAWQQRPSR